MKLTESMLRRMIREEAARLVESDDYPNWVGPGMKTLPGTAAQADAALRRRTSSANTIPRSETMAPEQAIIYLRRLRGYATDAGNAAEVAAYDAAIEALKQAHKLSESRRRHR